MNFTKQVDFLNLFAKHRC